MVLATHQLQGSYLAFPSRSSSWSKRVILKRDVVTLCKVGRTNRCLSLKHNFSVSLGTPLVGRLKIKPSKISAFKGSSQNGESGGRGSESKVAKSPAKLSYLPNDGEETMGESPKAHNIPLSYASEKNGSLASSPAIHKLFKKWLTMLRTQSPCPVLDEALGEGPPPRETSEAQNKVPIVEKGGILKAGWSHFWNLDATIKLPLLIFVPCFLAVNMIYGAEVTKELTPFWVFGPLVVALYIQMLRWLCALYVFSFKQTVKIVKNLPTYYSMANHYVADGKLKEDLRDRFWQPIVDIKNLDFKEVTRIKLKQLQEWLMEKYLDFVESIWPYYCQIIRFLKRANLI